MSELIKLNKKRYWAIIAEWQIKFGKGKPPPKTYSPSNVRTVCRKCDKAKKKMQRHHKANDFFFAYALPEVYAARYILFLEEDTDKLCEKCHKTWHRYVKPKLVDMYLEYRYFDKLPFDQKVVWCELWKGRLEKWYEKWADKPIKERLK